VVHKPANFRKAKEVIDIFREEGLTVLSNIIIGFPGESEESINTGVAKMMYMGANWYSVLTATPLHGSELYKVCKEKGYLPKGEEIFEIDYNKTAITTPEFTPAWIQWKAYETNLFLNFVHNYDMAIGEYNIPLGLFERVIEKVTDTHAFAYYYAAKCSKELGYTGQFNRYSKKYYEIVGKYAEWAEWAKHFNLEELC